MTAALCRPVRAEIPRPGFRIDDHSTGFSGPDRFVVTAGADASTDDALDAAARFKRAKRLLDRGESRLGRAGRHRTCPTGMSGLDEILGGGVPRGVLCEIVSAGEGVGAVSLALRTARAAAGEGGTIFVIDPRGDFYPPAAVRMGIALRQLVLVRPRRWAQAAWAMEQILRCGSVGATVGLFGVSETRAVRRLQLAAEAGGHVGLLVHDDSRATPACFAAVRMAVEGIRGVRDREIKGQRDAGIQNPNVGCEARGGSFSRRVLVRMLKGRTGMSTGSVVVEMSDATDDVRVHALSGYGSGGERRSATG